MTLLDNAHQAIELAEDPEQARRRFYDALTDAELFVILERDPGGGAVELRVMDPGSGPLVLAFDLEERLAEFAGEAAHYAALPGRVLLTALEEKSLGLGLNLGVAPSSFLLDAEGVSWIARRLKAQISAAEARFERFTPPRNVSEAFLRSVDSKLAAAAGLARAAYLVNGIEKDGAERLILVVVGARDGAETAIAASVAKGRQMIENESDLLDLLFIDEGRDDGARILDVIEKTGLKFDLPEPARPAIQTPAPPGSDPDKPPRLR